jgi:non-ribosomal peptide synthetase component E (peptide arylation enzyme)
MRGFSPPLTPEPGSDDQTLAGLILGQSPAASRERLATIALDPFQVAIFQLSGGTTGIPKIIPRFHNEYLAAIRSVISFHGLDDTTIAFTPNPMIHNSPMQCVWGPSLFAGGAVAICPSLDPAVQGPFLVRARPNWMLLSASVALRLKESGWLDRIETRVVRGFLVGSGAAKLRQLLGDAPTWPLFGMTEGLLCSCNASDPAAARTETTGRPLSPHDEIRLLVAGGDDEVAFGEIGELALRGPCTIRGYYDAADRNEVAFTVDGFYRSGDLMRQREIGGRHYLVFEGRLKDVVDRGGEKINCEEIERVCAQHPAIGDVAVVAMPDPHYGQRACAFVIPLAGRRAPDVRELGAFLERVGLAKFKWPERIEIVEAFPLTSSGKLSKPKLRERIEATLRAEQDVAQAGPNTQLSPRSLA